MKLTTFHVFANRLRQLEIVVKDASSANAYWYYDEIWRDENGAKLIDPPQLKALSHVRAEKLSHYRMRNQSQTYFYVEEIDAVAQVLFNTAPKQEKQRRCAKSIQACYLNAKNEFDAQHDSLTHLPNRAGFETALKTVVQRLANASSGSPSTAIESHPVGITLFAFDIDHFKQVNDTFGHQYGDVVLAAFAWRLDAFAKTLAIERGVEVTTARLGGEEFQLVVEEALNPETAAMLANRFRKIISDDPLPNENEWSKISSRKGLGQDLLPPLGERNITVSIGYTIQPSVIASAGVDDISRFSSELISQADTALYRAKADGRDCARSFREIRDRLGRILEHHQETNIVTIDIGSDVGVKDGTEFLVFHPQFSGDVPFYFSDGRTRKRLGTYPKVQSGRIVVFNTSREISFCRVKESQQVGLFPNGSRLQYVPLGSITHLVDDTEMMGNASLNDYAKLVSECDKLVRANKIVVAISLAVIDMEAIVNSAGTAAANEMLASLFKSLTSVLGEKALICVTASGEFSVVLSVDLADRRDFNELLSNMPRPAPLKPTCNIGIFDSRTITPVTEKPEMALECASLARVSTDSIAFFDEKTPERVIHKWKTNLRWAEAIADYKRVLSFGIRSAGMENAAGLCYLEMRPEKEYQRAIECFATATTLEPKQIYYRLNWGYALSIAGNHREALAKVATDLAGDLAEMQFVYLRRFSESIVALLGENNLPIAPEVQFAVLNKTIAGAGSANVPGSTIARLQEALIQIETREEK